jgi:regulatory protein
LKIQRITALKLQKRNHQRVNVYLDGEYAFGLARIVAAWLAVGTELSEEKIAQLKTEDQHESAYQRALNLINFRPRTEEEIRQNLQRHNLEEEIIQYVLRRLKENGLVNDAGFAQNWVENRAELRPRSRRALAYELKQRGVDSAIIEQTIDQVDDSAMAYQAAQRQAHKIKNMEWREFRLKMLRFLAQRGFSYEVSAEAARRVWEEQDNPELLTDEGVNL